MVYTRNDTGQAVNIETTKMLTQLRDLYPGAGYKIQVSCNKQPNENVYNSATQVLAVSHDLQSEPQTSYTAVLPNPARNLSILAVQVNRFIIEEENIGSKNINFVSSQDATISLQWLPPVNSLLTEYNIRYKPVVSPS